MYTLGDRRRDDRSDRLRQRSRRVYDLLVNQLNEQSEIFTMVRINNNRRFEVHDNIVSNVNVTIQDVAIKRCT